MMWLPKSVMCRTRVTFSSNELTLEGILHMPESKDLIPGVVVCHPHPLYGGSMYSKVIVAICKALWQNQIASLRFNFRGVGTSQGQFDKGVGELQDIHQAILYLSSYPGIDYNLLGTVGYSFGAAIALKAAEDKLIRTVASIAGSIDALSCQSTQSLFKPKLLISGTEDQIVPKDQFSIQSTKFSKPCEVHIIEKADHFFLGLETKVANIVAEFFGRELRQKTSSL